MAMNKRQKILWIIDVLTIVVLIITLQSIAVGVGELYGPSLKEKVLLSIQLCSACGWSEMLHDSLGAIVPWSKFLLFLANVDAVIRKMIGMKRKDISAKSRAFIVFNLLFIALKLIEFEHWWAGLMGV